MTYFRQILVSTVALVFASNVFATSLASTDCPPISTVKNSQFIQAKFKEFIGWDMTSNKFVFQGKEWNTLFGTATLDDELKSSEALNKGQTIFNSLKLLEPTKKVKSNITMCYYLFTDQYLVIAATPAVDLENSFFAGKR